MSVSDAPSRVLRVAELTYPPSWRADGRTAEITAVVLDEAEAFGRAHPDGRQVLNVMGHGVRARLHVALLAPTSRAQIAAACLSSGIGFAITFLVLGELPLPSYSHLSTSPGGPIYIAHSFGPFISLGVVPYCGWLVIALAWLAGRKNIALASARLTILSTMLIPIVSRYTGINRPPLAILAALAIMNLGLTISPAPPARFRARLIPVLAGLGIAGVAIYSSAPLFIGSWLFHSAEDFRLYLPLVSHTDGRYWFYWDGGGANSLSSRLPWLFLAAVVVAVIAHRRDTSVVTIAAIGTPWALLYLRATGLGQLGAAESLGSLVVPITLIVLLVPSVLWLRRRMSRSL